MAILPLSFIFFLSFLLDKVIRDIHINDASDDVVATSSVVIVVLKIFTSETVRKHLYGDSDDDEVYVDRGLRASGLRTSGLSASGIISRDLLATNNFHSDFLLFRIFLFHVLRLTHS